MVSFYVPKNKEKKELSHWFFKKGCHTVEYT